MTRHAAVRPPAESAGGISEIDDFGDLGGLGGVAAVAPRWTPRSLKEAAPKLSPNQIHLWAVHLAPLRLQVGATCLTAAELRRGDLHQDPRRRAMYLGGRIGMRLLLSAYSGIANDQLAITNGVGGKPALGNRSAAGQLCFNYTLSGDQALYAFAWNRQVGIDVETAPRRINAALLAKRKLTPAERRCWRAVPPPQRDLAMLACWTRKEAFGKALGVGIRYFLAQVPVFIDIHSPTWHCEVAGLFKAAPGGDERRTLHGIQLVPPFSGVAALVYDGTAADEDLQTWRLVPDAPLVAGAR